MIDTNLLSLEFKSLADRHCIPLHERQIFNIMLDNIDSLTAELDRYRWQPYPENKPEHEGYWQTTCWDYEYNKPFTIDSYYFIERDDWQNEPILDLRKVKVIAYRPMPEAYKPEERE